MRVASDYCPPRWKLGIHRAREIRPRLIGPGRPRLSQDKSALSPHFGYQSSSDPTSVAITGSPKR